MSERKHHEHNALLGMNQAFVPTVTLEDGERELERIPTDDATFWRSQATVAAALMAIGMAALAIIGNEFWWTGAVGALAAILVRAFYLGPDERKAVWVLTNQRILGPQNKTIPLSNLKTVNTIGSIVQLVTITGDKHLIRYQPNPFQTKAAIEAAARSV